MYVLIFFIALILNFLTILLSKRMSLGMDLAHSSKPQKMHNKSIPRIGGLGIFVAFSFGFFYQLGFGPYSWILLGLSVIFFGGLLEDLFDFIKPIYRLCIQSVGILLMLLSGYGLIVDLEPVTTLSFYTSIVFSIFGICGVCNALNIVDGLNGLASGIAILVLGVIFYLSDGVISQIALLALCSCVGFYVFNFPFGKIFLGDGGAYFLGALIAFLLAWMSNEGFSAWFGLSLMIYPVWEVVFSILRRKAKGLQAMQPDSLHLHSLLFRIMGNSLASLCLLFLYGIYLFFVVLLAHSAYHYILSAIIFILGYSVLYSCLAYRLKPKPSSQN